MKYINEYIRSQSMSQAEFDGLDSNPNYSFEVTASVILTVRNPILVQLVSENLDKVFHDYQDGSSDLYSSIAVDGDSISISCTLNQYSYFFPEYIEDILGLFMACFYNVSGDWMVKQAVLSYTADNWDTIVDAFDSVSFGSDYSAKFIRYEASSDLENDVESSFEDNEQKDVVFSVSGQWSYALQNGIESTKHIDSIGKTSESSREIFAIRRNESATVLNKYIRIISGDNSLSFPADYPCEGIPCLEHGFNSLLKGYSCIRQVGEKVYEFIPPNTDNQIVGYRGMDILLYGLPLLEDIHHEFDYLAKICRAAFTGRRCYTPVAREIRKRLGYESEPSDISLILTPESALLSVKSFFDLIDWYSSDKSIIQDSAVKKALKQKSGLLWSGRTEFFEPDTQQQDIYAAHEYRIVSRTMSSQVICLHLFKIPKLLPIRSIQTEHDSIYPELGSIINQKTRFAGTTDGLERTARVFQLDDRTASSLAHGGAVLLKDTNLSRRVVNLLLKNGYDTIDSIMELGRTIPAPKGCGEGSKAYEELHAFQNAVLVLHGNSAYAVPSSEEERESLRNEKLRRIESFVQNVTIPAGAGTKYEASSPLFLSFDSFLSADCVADIPDVESMAKKYNSQQLNLEVSINI